MEILTKYFLNANTSAIIPILDREGYSYVFEKQELFIVNQSPLEIIKEGLHYFSFNLKGSRWSGRLNMSPIAINSQLDLFWFPCNCPYNKDNIWFAVKHIIDTRAKGKEQTSVLLSYGHTIIVDMNKKRFDSKYGQSLRQRFTVKERIHSPEKFHINQPNGFIIYRNQEKDHYEIMETEKINN